MELLADPVTGLAIRETEAATLALRQRAERIPGIMQHARFQLQYTMLMDLFHLDKVMALAFRLKMPSLPQLGLRPEHWRRMSAAEAATGSRLAPDLGRYMASNRDQRSAVKSALQKWGVQPPGSLAQDVASSAYLQSSVALDFRSKVCSHIRERGGRRGYGCPCRDFYRT